jgi:hypothetical protein
LHHQPTRKDLNMGKAIKNVISMDSHRNGISGVPFNVIVFEATEGMRMVGIVFDSDGDLPRCAVLDIDKLNNNDVAFGSNSFRGDYFFREIQECFKEQMAE